MSIDPEKFMPVVKEHAGWAVKPIAWAAAIAIIVVLGCIIVAGPAKTYSIVHDAIWPSAPAVTATAAQAIDGLTAKQYFEKHKDEINPKTGCPHGTAICITGGGSIHLKCIRNGSWGPAVYTEKKTDLTAEDVKQNPPKGEWSCPPGYVPETHKP